MRRDESVEWARVHSWTQSVLDELTVEPASATEESRRSIVLKSRQQAAPIVEELRALGIPLWDLGELGNVRVAYPEAVPLLVKHLATDLPDDISLAIVHALAKPYGRVAFTALCDFLKRRAKTLPRTALFAIGAALVENAERSDLPYLFDVLNHSIYSLAREPVALRIARWRNDADIEAALVGYLRDGESPWTAIRALRLAKAWSAVDHVQRYAASDNAELRSEAKKYLQALQRAVPRLS